MATQTIKEAALEAVKASDASFGLADGVKPENVKRRYQALLDHGTEPLVARALAVDAETVQVHQDHQSAKERKEAEIAAHNAVPDKLRTLTLPKLREYADENSIEIPGDITLKDKVLAFLLAAYEDARKAKK